MDLEMLAECPWCCSSDHVEWGRPVRNFLSAECMSCKLIFVKNRLNEKALQKYYATYLTDMHRADALKNKQRELMYELEFKFIDKISGPGKVLDVGCGAGLFLDVFKANGYSCHGVEFGAEAAAAASKKHQIYTGNFSKLGITEKFDLIVFRGVIEHIPQPRAYLDEAVRLLDNGGYIFITSTPNADAFSCELFKEKWNQHVPEAHLMHFRPDHFEQYFRSVGLEIIAEYFFYEETPYANFEEDIIAVAKAIEMRRAGKPVDFISPGFWGNMMSIVYVKR